MGGEINTTFGNALSLGDFTVAANTHVSGEYTLATNYDGTTSNLYVNGDLITQTTPSPAISAGVKEFILGKEFDGYVKNFKFWNYAKSTFTPTYTASFSINDLTLTVNITNIIGANNSFYITLERDDGTILDTHTLVDGETSFTFTQTETSYTSYNYIIKVNGTQTDTYSATYVEPPYIQMRLYNNYTSPTFYVDRYNFDPTDDPLTIYYRHTIENVFQVGTVAQNYYNTITTLSQFQALGGVTQVNNVTSNWTKNESVSSTSYANRTQQMTWFFIVHSSRSVAYRLAFWYYTSTNDTDARNAQGKTGTFTNMNEIDL
jgi:hypothetical protein